ncbi:hypothetical protein GCM10009117_25660 [Gangjinia marincola]|uniref:Uncharacterized protein n=1 Tax=Gangjinia marincola TaxID=578463 RepID=A0ABP3XYH9_9FLAO
MKNLSFFLILLAFLYCNAQHETGNLIRQEQKLVEIYQKFSDHRHDYGENARDTILTRFKAQLLNTLKTSSYSGYPFDSLSTMMNVIQSNDQNLTIISWDELNGGTWHTFNSVYQYANRDLIQSDFLTHEKEPDEDLDFLDVTYYDIREPIPGNYLIKGYGTHGHGHEFFTLRLLSFNNNTLVDCRNCLNGKDKLVIYKARSKEDPIEIDTINNQIMYREYKEDLESGFMIPTGKTRTLHYKNGAYLPLKN